MAFVPSIYLIPILGYPKGFWIRRSSLGGSPHVVLIWWAWLIDGLTRNIFYSDHHKNGSPYFDPFMERSPRRIFLKTISGWSMLYIIHRYWRLARPHESVTWSLYLRTFCNGRIKIDLGRETGMLKQSRASKLNSSPWIIPAFISREWESQIKPALSFLELSWQPLPPSRHLATHGRKKTDKSSFC